MVRVAVLEVDSDSAVIQACGDDALKPLSDLMVELDARRTGPGRWGLPAEMVEPLCSALDREGFIWALVQQAAPRTWAERMFAEVPRRSHPGLLAALRTALIGEPDHLALLEFTWKGLLADGEPSA